MLVRGTRRFASGLAIALVVLTLYVVFYGSSTPSYPPWAGSHRTSLGSSGSGAGAGGGGGGGGLLPVDGMTDDGMVPKKQDNPLTPPGSDTTPPTPGGGETKDLKDDVKKLPLDSGTPDIGGLKPVNPDPFPGEPVHPGDMLGSKTTTAAAVVHTPKATESVFVPPPQKHEGPTKFVADTHRELNAKTTKDGSYWSVDFSPWPAYNPNFTPHPTKNDTWITVAQYHKTAKDNQVWFTQIICEAQFIGNSLKCTHPPWTVPIPPTWSEKCEGEISHFNFNIGPHDARVFYGPERPYILYGTQSSYSCFGQWFQDFTIVSDWPGTRAGDFRAPTEIQRPPPFKYGPVEKNWFLFWDDKDEIYVHHDIYPERVFGKMAIDGKIDKDAVVPIAAQEKQCLDKLLPYAQKTYAESIHQATNSLSIIMCKRSDPTCVKSPSNTFVFHIFHWKSFYEFHGLYEPYVHMFSRKAPFETYAVSTIPLWFRGRRLPGTWREEGKNGWNQTEMIYTTSIAWKDHGMKYEGYLDDTLLLGFGIEDKECGGMDITAGEIFQDLALCSGAAPPKISV